MLPPFLLDGQNNQTIATKITLDEVMAKIPVRMVNDTHSELAMDPVIIDLCSKR